MRDLAGKVVAITGAGGGIGAATALAFAQRGCQVALLDVSAEGLESVRAQIGESQPELRVSAHRVDVRDVDALASAAREIDRAHGGIDVMINNAGVTTFGPFVDLSDAEIARVFDINLHGVVNGCRVFLPRLQTRPSAHLVNVASEAGLAGMPCQSIYCATKFAVRGLTAALRAELASQGVGVTCVLPGATRTNILGAAPSTDPATVAQLHGLLSQRAPQPAGVARKIVRAVRRNKAELFVGVDSWALDWGVRFAPGLVRWSMLRAARMAETRAARAGGQAP